MGLPAMCTLVPDASVPIRLSGPSDFRWHIKYAAVSFQQRFLFCPLCLPEARSIQRTKANPYNILFEIVRIRLGFILLVFCVPRLTPPARLCRLPFQGRLNSAPRWGSCRASARLRGCGSLNGNSSKIPMAPPLPLRGTSPKGGSEGDVLTSKCCLYPSR